MSCANNLQIIPENDPKPVGRIDDCVLFFNFMASEGLSQDSISWLVRGVSEIYLKCYVEYLYLN